MKSRGGNIPHAFQGPENCKVLMSCESNPEVISTPMQQAKRQKYMKRRLGFLYHLTLSSAAICVTMGSENPSVWGTRAIAGAIVQPKSHPNVQGSKGNLLSCFFQFCDNNPVEKKCSYCREISVVIGELMYWCQATLCHTSLRLAWIIFNAKVKLVCSLGNAGDVVLEIFLLSQ